MNTKTITNPSPMKITPYDRDFRYLVGEKQYLVDLCELRGNGQCNCPDFRIRRAKAWEAGMRPSICKHISAVRLLVGEMLLDDMIRAKLIEENKRPHND